MKMYGIDLLIEAAEGLTKVNLTVETNIRKTNSKIGMLISTRECARVNSRLSDFVHSCAKQKAWLDRKVLKTNTNHISLIRKDEDLGLKTAASIFFFWLLSCAFVPSLLRPLTPPSPPFNAVPIRKAGDHYLSHLKRAKYTRSPYTLLSGITKNV